MGVVRSKVTAQGRTSVPAEVRRKLGIGPGSTLEWVQEGDRVAVRRAGDFSSEDIHRALFGSGTPARKTVEQMREGIRRDVRKRYPRG
jgi:AbrB family looped-hinge helix DNA binding protein